MQTLFAAISSRVSLTLSRSGDDADGTYLHSHPHSTAARHLLDCPQVPRTDSRGHPHREGHQRARQLPPPLCLLGHRWNATTAPAVPTRDEDCRRVGWRDGLLCDGHAVQRTGDGRVVLGTRRDECRGRQDEVQDADAKELDAEGGRPLLNVVHRRRGAQA